MNQEIPVLSTSLPLNSDGNIFDFTPKSEELAFESFKQKILSHQKEFNKQQDQLLTIHLENIEKEHQ